ncbi:hypothetical protein QJS10_CPB19g00053 [Acorus calamus]|uniref:Uncharacterized protein n=1 Tax=Acorus calamus TaxID=4465 RepID=A0AAV9CEQ2_ACOCL|nr:hypothetical protein QJS10_CPB19g00053 [Acorus calamus]
MAAENQRLEMVDPKAKYDACVDLTVRRFVYSSIAGGFGGLLLFKRPVTRWASVAFAVGVGVGSAYTECTYIMGGQSPRLAHLVSSYTHDETELTQKVPN